MQQMDIQPNYTTPILHATILRLCSNAATLCLFLQFNLQRHNIFAAIKIHVKKNFLTLA